MAAQSDVSVVTVHEGVTRRVSRGGLRMVLDAARGWAWANPAVPIGLAVAAVTSHLLHRRGRRTRLGDAVDATLSTVGPLLDPPQSTSRWRLPAPVAGVRHRVIIRLTRGARARRH